MHNNIVIHGAGFREPLTGIEKLSGQVAWQTTGSISSYLTVWNGLVFGAYSGDSPVAADGFFYVHDRIAAFEVASGEKVWETPVSNDIRYGSASVAGSSLYVFGGRVTGESKLYELDPESGIIRRERALPADAARMVIANGVIYVCSFSDTQLLALDQGTLKTVWSTVMERGCRDLVVANGRLYVVQGSSGLVAYGNLDQ